MKKRWLAVLVIIGLAFLVVLIFMKSRPHYYESPPIKVFMKKDRKVQTIALEDYLVGVVLAEMPASFNNEALKAQAVCARTYTIRRCYSASQHPGMAAVCDDSLHCQAYIDPNSLVLNRAWAEKKVRRAVQATRGQVITYQGELIDPVYHSTCGGHTESSQDVWGNRCPYLQGVQCLWDRSSRYYRKVFKVDKNVFCDRLKLEPGDDPIPSMLERSENGMVKRIGWKNKSMTGTKFRELLGLPSARFTIFCRNGQVIINTIGYGHGVGMCQYGADGLAEEGKSYLEILHYYYKGVTICQIQY